jgi:superfamily I DNA and/or RNA helicase
VILLRTGRARCRDNEGGEHLTLLGFEQANAHFFWQIGGLEPCFMMEALSVARYLEPGLLQFDVVIMDEASQPKPEDAQGAIALGAQLVVVGDPKQLSPTTFFARTMDDGDIPDDELTAAERSGAERCCQRRSS